MNDIGINQVLAQIRAMQTQTAPRPTAVQPAVQGGGFDSLLTNAIGRVNETQNDASRLQKAFELGDPTADLPRVMLASATAQVSFKAAVEVRNRLVNAYQEIMNMPI